MSPLSIRIHHQYGASLELFLKKSMKKGRILFEITDIYYGPEFGQKGGHITQISQISTRGAALVDVKFDSFVIGIRKLFCLSPQVFLF